MGEEEDEVHTIARRVFYDDMTGEEGHVFGGFFGNMVSDEMEGEMEEVVLLAGESEHFYLVGWRRDTTYSY